MSNETLQNGSRLIPDLLWYSCESMMVIDEQRRVLGINPALERLLGRKNEEVAGKSECGVLLSCRDLQGCELRDHPWECPGLKALRSSESVRSAEYTIRSVGGKALVVCSSYTPIQLPGHPPWALVVMRDITVQKKRELQLVQQAKTDPLTRLPNRTALLETCRKELNRAARFSRSLAIGMIDIDGFKHYNDTYGHLAGDDLLRALPDLLQTGRRAADLIARYGGDEFTLLLPETDAAGAIILAERICLAVAHFPFAQTGEIPTAQSVSPITISVGVAVFPEEGNQPEALLSQADQRLYEAKRQGGNRVVGPPP